MKIENLVARCENIKADTLVSIVDGNGHTVYEGDIDTMNLVCPDNVYEYEVKRFYVSPTKEVLILV